MNGLQYKIANISLSKRAVCKAWIYAPERHSYTNLKPRRANSYRQANSQSYIEHKETKSYEHVYNAGTASLCLLHCLFY